MVTLLKTPNLKEGKVINDYYPEQVLPLTFRVLDSEPCYSMGEFNLPSPGYRGFHRYRIFMVARDDRLHEHREDMGPAKSFKADELRILGGSQQSNGKYLIVHTVGEMREMSRQWHEEYATEKGKEPVQPHDLGRLLCDFQEAKRMIQRGLKSFLMKGAI